MLSSKTEADLTSFVEEALSAPILFFVGSGISIPFPSCLPSAWKMIDLTLKIVAPKDLPAQEVEAICNALPEMFYEGLYQIVGEVAIEPWKIITFGEISPNLFTYPIKPNTGHLSIAYLSWRNSLPIITTNFDLFFEGAAKHLGLNPVVSVPSKEGTWRLANRGSSEVAIWKVHGSVDRIESICTTLQRISQLNFPLISGLRELFTKHRACLLGYSGRDIDLFPFMSQFDFPQKAAFWICKSFGKDHGIHSCPEKFIGIKGGSELLAQYLINKINDNSEPARKLKKALNEEKKYYKNDEHISIRDKNLRTLLSRGEEFIKERLEPFFKGPKDSNRLLVYGISLANVQKFELAAGYLKKYLEKIDSAKNPSDFVRASLVLSSCYHNLSKYEQAENVAVKSLKVCQEFDLKEEKAESLAQRDEALRMQHLPNLKFKDWIHFFQVDSIVVLFRFIIDLFRIKSILSNPKNVNQNPKQIRLWHIYLEHCIRLLAIIQRGLNVIFGKYVMTLPLAWAWTEIYNQSYNVGYAAGIANAIKYCDRLTDKSSMQSDTKKAFGQEIVSSRQVYELISHRNGLALIARDRGDYYLGNGVKEKAAKMYKMCIDLSKRDKNLSLELKGYLGLQRCGEKVDLKRIKYLLDEIEGTGYKRIKESLLNYLTNPNSRLR